MIELISFARLNYCKYLIVPQDLEEFSSALFISRCDVNLLEVHISLIRALTDLVLIFNKKLRYLLFFQLLSHLFKD